MEQEKKNHWPAVNALCLRYYTSHCSWPSTAAYLISHGQYDADFFSRSYIVASQHWSFTMILGGLFIFLQWGAGMDVNSMFPVMLAG